MTTKLTLVMDRPIIERAKAYARRNRTSLSRMAQEYFAAVTRGADLPGGRHGPITASLLGIGRLPDDEAGLSDKELLAKALAERHA